MIKKSLKSAIGVSIGLTFGGYVLPRFLNENYLPFSMKQVIVYLLFSYSIAFLVSLLINIIKSKSVG